MRLGAAEPSAEHDQRRVERVREHREHACRGVAAASSTTATCAGSASTSSAALDTRRPGERAAARDRSTGGAPSTSASPRPPAYGRPSTTRQALAPVPTITKRNGERRRLPRSAPRPAQPPARRTRAPRSASNAAAGVEVAPVDRVRARRPAVEVDQLAEPDADRQRPAAELRARARRSRRAPPPRRAPAASAAPRARARRRSRRRRGRRRSSCRRRRSRRATVTAHRGDARPTRFGPRSHRSIVSYPAAEAAAPDSEGGNVNRRLAVGLVARRRRCCSRSARARRTAGRAETDHADDVVVRQPGPGPPARAPAAEQEVREEPSRA